MTSVKAWVRGLVAGLLVLALGTPFAKPFACGAAGAAETGHAHHAAPSGSVAVGTATDQPVCHDPGICAPVLGAPLLDGGNVLLLPAATTGSAVARPTPLADAVFPPGTPPPRA